MYKYKIIFPNEQVLKLNIFTRSKTFPVFGDIRKTVESLVLCRKLWKYAKRIKAQ